MSLETLFKFGCGVAVITSGIAAYRLGRDINRELVGSARDYVVHRAEVIAAEHAALAIADRTKKGQAKEAQPA